MPPMASARVQRWALQLAAYQYTFRYKPGRMNANADALSRLPLPGTPESDRYPPEIVHVLDHLEATPISAKQIRAWTVEDPVLQLVKEYTQSRWPSRIPEGLEPYAKRRLEMAVEEGCLMVGNRVIIPPPGRATILDELHSAHPGISRMMGLARAVVWWPNIDHDIERVVKHCDTCQRDRPNPPLAPLHTWEWPRKPWSRVHVDYAGPFLDHMFLILIDAHSKWIEVYNTGKLSTAEITIRKCREAFVAHGLPDAIVSDNGPCFTSSRFQDFLNSNGIRHITVAPYHPASNGLAEKAVQTFKAGMRKIHGDTLEVKIARFLMAYRTTPHTTTGVSPAELLLGRRLKTRLDLVRPDITFHVTTKQAQQKQQQDWTAQERHFDVGDSVYIGHHSATGRDWRPGTITEVTGPVSYRCQMEGGGSVRKHVDQLRERAAEIRTEQSRTDPLVSTQAELAVHQPESSRGPLERQEEMEKQGAEAENQDMERGKTPEVSRPVKLRRSERTVKAPDRLNL